MTKIIVDEIPYFEDECPFSYAFGIDNDTKMEIYRCFIAQLKEEKSEDVYYDYKNCKYLASKKVH